MASQSFNSSTGRIVFMKTSIASGGSTPASSSLRQMMQQHPLFSFFFMAYAFSWIMGIPYILSQWGILHGDFRIAFVLKSFGPFLAAFIMTGILEGKDGVQRLRHSLRPVRAGWQWYLFILLGIPALFLLGISVLPGALASFQGFPPNFPIVYVVTFVLIFFGGGPLGEEPGWRGFALPRMQPLYGPLKGTLLLGVLWVFWHLPDFLTDAQRGGPGTGLAAFFTNFPIFFLMVISMAIIFTWVFNHNKGSLFIVILLHASINTFSIVVPLFAAPSVTSTDLPILIGVIVPAVLIIILTRGRLGYQPSIGQPLASDEIKTQPYSANP
jgi:membrane protease YdiL (CAAX protease family)